MDQELIAYLDARFGDVTQRIETLREQVDKRFEQVDKRFEQVDKRFEQVDKRFEQVDQHFETLEASVRETQVSVEGIRHENQILAEAILGWEEKVQIFRNDMSLGFEQVKASIVPYYENLDSRLKLLEFRAERERQDPMEILRQRHAKSA